MLKESFHVCSSCSFSGSDSVKNFAEEQLSVFVWDILIFPESTQQWKCNDVGLFCSCKNAGLSQELMLVIDLFKLLTHVDASLWERNIQTPQQRVNAQPLQRHMSHIPVLKQHKHTLQPQKLS